MTKKLNSYFWFIFLPAHLFLVFAMIGFKLNGSSFLIELVLWTLISGYGIGVAYHRLLAHKTFKTQLWIEFIISYFGCLAIQGSPIFWVNLHRGYHHPHADTEFDIQSPAKGWLWGYLLWPITTQYKEIRFRFANDLLRNRGQRILHFGYFFIIWGTWAVAFLFSTQFFYLLVIAQAISLHQEFCVNLFCHIGKGYRNFEIPDRSVNRYWFGLFFWGVGYHNNHHARPQSYNFAFKKNEFDPTILLVHLIKKDI